MKIKDFNLLHPANIKYIVVTLDVSNEDKSNEANF